MENTYGGGSCKRRKLRPARPPISNSDQFLYLETSQAEDEPALPPDLPQHCDVPTVTARYETSALATGPTPRPAFVSSASAAPQDEPPASDDYEGYTQHPARPAVSDRHPIVFGPAPMPKCADLRREPLYDPDQNNGAPSHKRQRREGVDGSRAHAESWEVNRASMMAVAGSANCSRTPSRDVEALLDQHYQQQQQLSSPLPILQLPLVLQQDDRVNSYVAEPEQYFTGFSLPSSNGPTTTVVNSFMLRLSGALTPPPDECEYPKELVWDGDNGGRVEGDDEVRDKQR